MGLPYMDALMGMYIHMHHFLYNVMIARYRFSRKVIWLEVASTNNDSAVIAGYYLSAVEKYGAEVSLLFFSLRLPQPL